MGYSQPPTPTRVNVINVLLLVIIAIASLVIAEQIATGWLALGDRLNISLSTVRTHLRGGERPRWTGVHPQAWVAPSARIGKDVAIPEIARALNVSSILEGSVRKSGDKVRITVQLIRAADGCELHHELPHEGLSLSCDRPGDRRGGAGDAPPNQRRR